MLASISFSTVKRYEDESLRSLVVVSLCIYLGVLHRKRRTIDKLQTGPATSAKLELLLQTVVMPYRCPCTDLHCFTYTFPIHYLRTLYSANVHTFLGLVTASLLEECWRCGAFLLGLAGAGSGNGSQCCTGCR